MQSEFTRCEVELRCPMFSVKSVLAGEEVYHFGDRAVLLKAGTFLLVPAGASYRVTVKSRWPTVGRCFYWSDDDATGLLDLYELMGEGAGPCLFDLSLVDAELQGADLRLGQDQVGSRFNRWARSWADQLVRVDRVDPLSRSRVLRGLERARRAMEDDPSENWSTATLASLAGQSRSAFSRSFSSVYGIGPRRMLEHYRMELALRELDQGNRALTELAQDCGYSDLPTFSKAFRRRFGVAPSKWRRDARLGTN
ncbi:MAG: helix-turn-helix domain-containing protein [Wenzhouxiangella sp.]|nr:helix-turn-helix domain-containing protein [Wenzhouxiangella sp.]